MKTSRRAAMVSEIPDAGGARAASTFVVEREVTAQLGLDGAPIEPALAAEVGGQVGGAGGRVAVLGGRLDAGQQALDGVLGLV